MAIGGGRRRKCGEPAPVAQGEQGEEQGAPAATLNPNNDDDGSNDGNEK